MREITSATNPQIKQLRALISTKKARQESGTFIIEGWRGIETLLNHPSTQYLIETLVMTPEWKDHPKLQSGSSVPQEKILLPAHLFEKISDVRNTQGILAVVRTIPTAFSVPTSGRFLLVDNLRDPGNLGSLIRSAVGAGFAGVLLFGDCVEPFNPKVIRSTMGTFAYLNIWNVGPEELHLFEQEGYELCVTTGLGGENLYASRFSNKTILVIGSEAHGVGEELMARADRKITIPLRPECESLNAAIAGSICMFQIAGTPAP